MSHFLKYYAELHYALCRFAECRGAPKKIMRSTLRSSWSHRIFFGVNLSNIFKLDSYNNGTACFFKFSCIIEGAAEKCGKCRRNVVVTQMSLTCFHQTYNLNVSFSRRSSLNPLLAI